MQVTEELGNQPPRNAGRHDIGEPEASMRRAHRWQPISDLPPRHEALCRPDLHAAQAEWSALRTTPAHAGPAQRALERLAMLQAIETGAIERLYSVSSDVTQALAAAGVGEIRCFRERGEIGEEAAALIIDQRTALDMVQDIASGQRRLTSSYIKELHRGLTEHQDTRDAVDALGRRFAAPLLKGEWKRLPNNPITVAGELHEYCPPEFVQDEIERLLAWSERHDEAGVCAEVEAAWLHHRFAQIHPFEDGNGRVSRALAAAVFVRAGYPVPVVRDREHRESYMEALASADDGNLAPLVNLLADIVRTDIEEALQGVTASQL